MNHQAGKTDSLSNESNGLKTGFYMNGIKQFKKILSGL